MILLTEAAAIGEFALTLPYLFKPKLVKFEDIDATFCKRLEKLRPNMSQTRSSCVV